jgi:hypothetical protein
VILLDEQAGWTAFRRAQQRDPALASIPVIAISPLQRAPAAVYAAAEPIDVGLLITIVRRLCSGSSGSAAYPKAGAHQIESHEARVRLQVA